MDNIILSFTKEQLDIYQRLKNSSDIVLDFDASAPELPAREEYNLDEFVVSVEAEFKKLLSFKKYDSTFSVSLTQDEIKALIPVYYSAILGIERHVKALSSNTRVLAMNISQADRVHTSLCSRYADFLPYKAALYDRDNYKRVIAELDDSFRQSIRLAEDYLVASHSRLKKVEAIHAIIQEFYKGATEASDAPKFKKFDARAFFYTIEAFIEQLKATK